MTYKPEPNSSVSHGTMRTQDLLRCFANELGRFEPLAEHSISEAHFYADRLDRLDFQGKDDTATHDQAAYCLAELFDALGQHVPDGCYFGSHPGDGSDYGYWQAEIDEEDGE
jgi:hypothetical protein